MRDDPGPRSGPVADAVGAAELGAPLPEFAYGWDRRRADLVEALRALQDSEGVAATRYVHEVGGPS